VVFDALLPATGDPIVPDGVLDVDIASTLADVRDAGLRLRVAIAISLLAATWVAPLLIRHRPPLDRLSRDERELALDAMAESRIATLRQFVVVLKIVVSMAYGADETVRARLGYSRWRSE
jgi:hypothetical protein